jgi:hypothetical protein
MTQNRERLIRTIERIETKQRFGEIEELNVGEESARESDKDARRKIFYTSTFLSFIVSFMMERAELVFSWIHHNFCLL